MSRVGVTEFGVIQAEELTRRGTIGDTQVQILLLQEVLCETTLPNCTGVPV